MPIEVRVKIRSGPELIRALDRVESAIKSGITGSVGRRLGMEGLRIVKQLTPRQKSRIRLKGTRRGHPAFFKQWRLIEIVANETAYKAIIQNKAINDPKGLIALASVEFGAVGHDIPKAPGRTKMRWRQESTSRRFMGRSSLVGGGESVTEKTGIGKRAAEDIGDIRAWTVEHPGNEAFHMVKDTREQMGRLADSILSQFKTRIEAEFGPLKITVR